MDSFSAYVLIDSGASNSFIAYRVAEKLQRDREVFTYPFVTVTPSGDRYESFGWYKDIPIIIEDHVLKANLIELGMVDYDVIFFVWEWIGWITIMQL